MPWHRLQAPAHWLLASFAAVFRDEPGDEPKIGSWENLFFWACKNELTIVWTKTAGRSVFAEIGVQGLLTESLLQFYFVLL